MLIFFPHPLFPATLNPKVSSTRDNSVQRVEQWESSELLSCQAYVLGFTCHSPGMRFPFLESWAGKVSSPLANPHLIRSSGLDGSACLFWACGNISRAGAPGQVQCRSAQPVTQLRGEGARRPAMWDQSLRAYYYFGFSSFILQFPTRAVDDRFVLCRSYPIYMQAGLCSRRNWLQAIVLSSLLCFATHICEYLTKCNHAK